MNLRGVSALASRLRNWPPAVGPTPAQVIHRENKWRLLRYECPEPVFKTPILLIPSLINRYYVLDLAPGRSLVEHLIAAGHEVHCIDWGTPGPEDRLLSFDDICDRAIGRAVRRVASTAPSGRTHILGYCLGGTLATIHAAARPELVASLTALAAPIDFDRAGTLSRWVRTPSFDVEGLVGATGNVPWRLMHGAFHLLRPTGTLAKWVRALDQSESADALDGLFAVERWSTDNVSFPGEAYRRYITALYDRNELARGRFQLSGVPATLESLECPIHVIAFEGDNIVPAPSALALAELAGSDDIVVWCRRGSHVGSVVSRRAATGLWADMSRFWADRDCPNIGQSPPPTGESRRQCAATGLR